MRTGSWSSNKIQRDKMCDFCACGHTNLIEWVSEREFVNPIKERIDYYWEGLDFSILYSKWY